ncbi:NPC1-like intracellular cholesterol transporter 1 [Trichomycterus rosablanca]|uniref:NPC1-like intracellular cholesterol transporter 1 n=1 Tax=Trichomycterus rosablanca TaxID=2290929 RepID=UPI002F35A56C
MIGTEQIRPDTSSAVINISQHRAGSVTSHCIHVPVDKSGIGTVLAGAQPQPGFCVMYDECGLNPEVEGSLIPAKIPCKNYVAAKPLTGQHYQLFKQVCPMLDQGEGQTFGCCTQTQLYSLQSSLTLSKAVLLRCPACVYNFAHVHCITTCSSNQSQIINITRTANVSVSGVQKEAVLAYQAYVSTNFSEATFRSCQNVRIPATGGYAIATMCGRYGHKLCTAQRWLDFQGDTSNGLAPLDIDFRLIPPGQTSVVPAGMVPYAGMAIGCNETGLNGEEECSCQDCLDACPSIPPPAPLSEPFMIAGIDGVLFICLIVFIFLSLLFLGFLVAKFVFQTRKAKKSGKDKNANEIDPTKKVDPKDVTCSDRASLAVQKFLGSYFQTWGTLMAKYPVVVIVLCLIAVVAFSAGLMKIELTTDPVQLWSAPNSRARREKDFNDKHFTPFFRTNQLILTAPDRTGYVYDSLLFGKNNFSGLLDKDLILQLLELQQKIQAIEFWSEELNKTASLKNICYAPLNPENPSLTDCAVNSLPQYFQNSVDNLNAKANMTQLGVTKEVDWRDHFIYCVNSPLSFKDITALGMSCMANYGGPVFPFLAVGGYENDEYTNSEAFVVTFSLNNYPRNHTKFKVVEEWESRFLKIVKDYQANPKTNFSFAYMAERSLEDEINRTTIEDIPIFMISYAVIFIYIAVALGEYSSFKRILVDSKLLVGFGGILVVGCSVLSSMGFYAWIGQPSSLVILQVVPFLVLAVGADNIFIFVLEYQRDLRHPGEKREEQIGRVLGNVGPSMLLCSLSESVCFFLGALSSMPAVKSFALYAALAILMDFVLQMTAFVALLSLDARRQDANRCEIICCATVQKSRPTKPNEGFLLPVMRKYYAPVLLHPVSRIIVIVLFLCMFCASIFLMFHVKVGLDQELAMPTDSYMLKYFEYLNKYFEVGVPTYFITTKGFNFKSVSGMNGVCSSVGCDQFSLTQKIQYATAYPERSYLAIPASSWVDDFIDWLNPQTRCCRIYTAGPNKGKFCPASENALMCLSKCMKNPSNGVLRPNVDEFNKYLPSFLSNRPDLRCPKGGLGAYDTAVVRDNVTGEIIASRFMAYHIPLTNSQEFTAALIKARELAHNITMEMRRIPGTAPDFEVFPYTVTYVYYEQYITIVYEGLVNLSLCLLPTFVVCCILLGMDIRSGLLNLLTIVMITIDTVGVMTLWGIDYNAVSLINLVTAVGISVEFVSHLTRSFALSTLPTKVDRAKDATARMGSAVFAGVAMTNLPGIVVLAFAKAQLIQIFFFRLNLIITLLGMAHGLIFLPVLLSFFGPPVNNALLLEMQEKKAMEMRNHSKTFYDNLSFAKDENHVSSTSEPAQQNGIAPVVPEKQLKETTQEAEKEESNQIISNTFL